MFGKEENEHGYGSQYGYAKAVMVDTVPPKNPDYVPSRMLNEVFIYSLERKKGYRVFVKGDLIVDDYIVTIAVYPSTVEVVDKPSNVVVSTLNKKIQNNPSIQESSSTFVLEESEFEKCKSAIETAELDKPILLQFSLRVNQRTYSDNNIMQKYVFQDNNNPDFKKNIDLEKNDFLSGYLDDYDFSSFKPKK